MSAHDIYLVIDPGKPFPDSAWTTEPAADRRAGEIDGTVVYLPVDMA